jgi:N utilization substance protein B
MSNNRRIGREYALKILFALKYEANSVSADRILEQFWKNFRFSDDILGEPLDGDVPPLAQTVRQFTEQLVRGVLEYRPLLDRHIGEAAQNWSLTRMSAVDLALLRIATFELLFQPDIPVAVTLNEAIEIAKRYGTKDSPNFINGLLDKIARNAAVVKA